MKRLTPAKWIVLGFLIPVIWTSAQTADKQDGIEVQPLGRSLYRLSYTKPIRVSVIASVGDDGLLLVDSGHPQTAAALHEKLLSFGKGEVRVLINTHYHQDHTGGNAQIGKDAVILAHPNVRKRMTSGFSLLLNLPEHALPARFVRADTTIRFNGEQIRLIPMTGGHTDGDILVEFQDAGIVFMGDQIFPDSFPYLETGAGGNIDVFRKNLETSLGLFGDDALFISAHGRDYSKQDIRAYIEMIEKTSALVRGELAKGATAAELKERKLLKDWDSWERGFVNADAWINVLSAAPGAPKSSIIDPLMALMKDKDGEAAAALYHDLKKNHENEYDFGEFQLNAVGYYLLQLGRVQDAIRIFQLNVEVFPDAWNTYDSLAEAYMKLGNKELAVRFYKKSLELNPQNDNAREKLKSLE